MIPALPSDKVDAVIVGGGIVGCAAALFAARSGLDVVLVDKGGVGFEQSTRNWGWVHQQVRHPHLVPLAVYSRTLWEGLAADLGPELGPRIEWRQGGNFSFARTHADMEAFEDYRAKAAFAGLDSRLLSTAETAAMLPGIGNEVHGALYVPTDGQANPRDVTWALARAARGAGARIFERCAAEAIETTGGAVTGVMTEHGRIAAEQVVVAAGAWSRRLLKPLGIEIPQTAIRSTVVRTHPAPRLTDATGWAHEVAFRQDAGGRFVLAAGAPSTFDVDLHALRDLRAFWRMAVDNRRRLRFRVGRPLLRDVRHALLRRSPWRDLRTDEPAPDSAVAEPNLRGFERLFPQYRGLAVERIWAGNIDMTPDQAPVLDADVGIEGLVVATGFSGHGFAMGPGGGWTVAELLNGRSGPVDLHGFRLSRFAEEDLPALAAFHP